MEDFLKQINQDIKDIFQYNIETTTTYSVPARHDTALTFPIGAEKRGKLLETCVLMIDIRNSTSISRQLIKDKVRLGKIYSAFIYAMADIADEYGYVRNIIGDRLMVVFEPKDCFANAIKCAALMYTVAVKVLSKYVGIGDFKIGIGVDFGEMLVLKTGIRKKQEEQSEYKSLVWIGNTANIASKLCDFANKPWDSTIFKITFEYFSFEEVLNDIKPPTYSPLTAAFLGMPNPVPKYKREYMKKTGSASLTCSEFNTKVDFSTDGMKYNGNRIVSISKENTNGNTSPILISGKVYSEFKACQSTSPLVKTFTSKDYPGKPYTGTGVWGGYYVMPEIIKIKIG